MKRITDSVPLIGMAAGIPPRGPARPRRAPRAISSWLNETEHESNNSQQRNRVACSLATRLSVARKGDSMRPYKDVRRLVPSALLLVVTVACGDGRSSNAAGPSRTSERPPTIVNGTTEIGDLTVAALFVPTRANATS